MDDCKLCFLLLPQGSVKPNSIVKPSRFLSLSKWVKYLNFTHEIRRSVGGIVVSIAAFQAVDPGSIPGQRRVIFFFPFLFI